MALSNSPVQQWRRGSARLVVGVTLAGVGLLLLVMSQQARGATAAPGGCPDGYRWERMSGVGCVQTALPPHAQYSYTSAVICSDPYVAVRDVGPNAFGNDPQTTYLVECIKAAEAAARASAGTSATPQANDGSGFDADDALGSGPLDKLADFLWQPSIPPAPADADLGGVAATGVLLMSIGGAVVAGGAGGLAGLGGATGGLGGGTGAGAAGGPASADGKVGSSASAGAPTAAPTAAPHAAALPAGTTGGEASAASHPASAGHLATAATHQVGTGAIAAAGGISADAAAVGNLTTAAGSGLPLPRPELIVAGLSIFRSMKRVTEEADPTGYSAGDLAQLMGDAAGIGALASILAPAAGLVSLATAGAAAGADIYSPQEVLWRLRRNFGQLGYMQGILDENVSQVDGQLAGLDGSPQGSAAKEAPEIPADPSAMSDVDLRAARSAWAERADSEFDSLIRMQEEINDLDDRRRNLDHQVDAVGDFLARLDEAGTTVVPAHLGDTLRYGVGWYLAGDPERMAAALRESRSRAREAGKPAMTSAAETATQTRSTSAGRKKGTPFAEWAAANQIEGGRLAVLEALAGLERWCGFYDALTGTLQRQLLQMRAQADAAGATRRALSAEMQRRTLAIGEK